MSVKAIGISVWRLGQPASVNPIKGIHNIFGILVTLFLSLKLTQTLVLLPLQPRRKGAENFQHPCDYLGPVDHAGLFGTSHVTSALVNAPPSVTRIVCQLEKS